jgi:hypothetical protein
MRTRGRPSASDIAAEIVRRANGADCHVIRLSEPPTCHERLQLLTAKLQRTPIVIMPQPCKSMEEWIGRYGRLNDH